MKSARLILLGLFLFTLTTASFVLAGDGAISSDLLSQFQNDLKAEPGHKQIINAITNNSIKDLSLNREKIVNFDKLFTYKLKSTNIINQKSSGRCWIFAAANISTPKVMNKLNASDFEMSQSYLAFYDKLEKANFFLERMIELRDKPLDDRSLQIEIQYLFGDGGWWNYFLDLVNKYGIVPAQVMPETKQSEKTGMLNQLGSTLLRKYAAELRQMHQDGRSENALRKAKEKMLADVYKLLVYNYGEPPQEFKFRYEYKDEDDTTKTEKEIIERTFTPQSFFKEFIGDDMPEYVSLCNYPTQAFNENYLLESSRNMYEGEDFKLLNLDIEKLKYYTRKTLLDSQLVWFACDVGRDNYNADGIFSVDVYDYTNTLGIDFSMDKKTGIEYGYITPSHAMAITGFDTAADGSINKWLVENSWGTKYGDNGFYYMKDDWYDAYVLVVIVPKNLLDEADLKLLDKKPITIKDYEPFSAGMRNIQ